MARGRPAHHKPLIDVIGAKRRVALIEKQYELAMAGDTAAAKQLLDRMDPTLARQELTGRDGAAIQVQKPDLSALSNEDLRMLEEIAERRESRRPNGSGNGSATQH